MDPRKIIKKVYGVPTSRLRSVFASRTYYGSDTLKANIYIDDLSGAYYLAWNKDCNPGDWNTYEMYGFSGAMYMIQDKLHY